MRERKKKTNDQTENTNRTLIENRLRFKRTTAATTTILRQNTVSNTSASERFAQIILQNTSFSPRLCAPSVGSSTRQACVRNYEYFLVSLSLSLSRSFSFSSFISLSLPLLLAPLLAYSSSTDIYLLYIFLTLVFLLSDRLRNMFIRHKCVCIPRARRGARGREVCLSRVYVTIT